MNKEIRLSERLQKLSELVIREEPMADIGTDHGFLPLCCLQRGLVPFAVASDVNEGPLEKAEANRRLYGIDGTQCSLRLGSGLDVLQNGEVSSVVIAGMGGELIASILARDPEKTRSIRRFILQPRTRSGQLRSWLWDNGWSIREEHLAREKRRLCQILCVEQGIQAPYEYPDIPQCEDPLMIEFLDRELVNIRLVIENLARSRDPQDLETARSLQEKARALDKRRETLWKKRNSSTF